MKKILFSLIMLCSLFLMTGCKEKVTDQDLVNSALATMQEIDYYKSTVALRYSDEEKTINASFVSQVDTEDTIQYFKGKINMNDEVYDTLGYYNDEAMAIKDVNNNMIKVNNKVVYIKDLKLTDAKKITHRSGEENLEYYNVTINDKYKARIGIGNADNVIYTIFIDLKANGLASDKTLGVYEIELTIDDTEEEMPKDINTSIFAESNDFFTIFNKNRVVDKLEEINTENATGGVTNEIA